MAGGATRPPECRASQPCHAGHHEPSCLGAASIQLVVEVQPEQVLRVHAPGHARAVGVPGHQVDRRCALALEVVVDDGLPQQVLRAHQHEGAAHLAAFEHALLVHRRFQQGQLAGVDEEGQLTGLGEVHLCGEHRHRGQPLVLLAAISAEGRRTDGQQRAADAVAHGMHLALRADGAHGIERGMEAVLHVVVHAEVAVALAGVLPRHHEHRVAVVAMSLGAGAPVRLGLRAADAAAPAQAGACQPASTHSSPLTAELASMKQMASAISSGRISRPSCVYGRMFLAT